MICQPCKTAGDINEYHTNPDGRRYYHLEEIEAIKARIRQLHSECNEHDCMCQHRQGVYVARGQEKGTSGSTPGNGGTGSEDGAPSQGSLSEPQ
jgi:hypothetical protein